MAKRSDLINRYFVDLTILTKIDKKKLQEIFVRRVKEKTCKSDKYLRYVTFTKNVRVVDSNHKFFKEYDVLKVGDKNWFENLSKSFKSYIGWWLYNKNTFDSKPRKSVSDFIYQHAGITVRRIVLENFLDEYLDEDGEVCAEAYSEFYYNNKLEESYYQKLFRLYLYIIEDCKYEMLNQDGSIKPEYLLDYCVLGEKIPYSVHEKIRVSVGRTKENFDALAKANCEKFKYFVTLTFADKEEKEKHLKLNEKGVKDGEYNLKFIYVENITDLSFCNKALNRSFSNLKKFLKNKKYEFYYLGCPEYHANGCVHYHFLFSDIPNDCLYTIPKWLDYDYITKTFNNGTGLVNWRYGKSDVQLIQDEYKVTSYIAKYIEKSLDEIDGTVYFERLNKKRYLASNNLKKPEITYSGIEEIDFEMKSVYVKERKSKFNDNEITDILYSI